MKEDSNRSVGKRMGESESGNMSKHDVKVEAQGEN